MEQLSGWIVVVATVHPWTGRPSREYVGTRSPGRFLKKPHVFTTREAANKVLREHRRSCEYGRHCNWRVEKRA